MRLSAAIASGILFLVFLYLVLNGAEQVRFITVAFVLVFAVLATRLDDIRDLTFGPTGLAAKLEAIGRGSGDCKAASRLC